MVKDIVKKMVREFLLENKTYDSLLSLEKWYDIERGKLESINKYKEWKIKNNLLYKQYLTKKNEIIKKENPYGLEGDIKANYIYHYTTGQGLYFIINDNMLKGGGNEYGGISFTSNPNLYKRGFIFWHPSEYSEGRHHGNVGVKMKFDFNKMKNDGLKFIKGSEYIGTVSGEDELRLKQNELKNPLKYVKEIIIFKDKEVDYNNLVTILKNNNISFKLI